MYYQEAIECMPREELEKLQLERLKQSLVHAYEKIPFYKERFDAAGADPYAVKSLTDLAKFPFTVKQDIRDNYPFGMFAADKKDLKRIHASSGTTGMATVIGSTEQDLKNWGDCFARGIAMVGGSEESTIQISYGYGLFSGGLGAHLGGEAMGCAIVPASTGNTKRQVQLMKDFEVDILACTPSYALRIADEAIAEGLDPRTDLKVSGAILGAEPVSPGMREEIQEKLGVKYCDVYGLSEVMGPGVAMECGHGHGMHIAEDHFLVEIVDPETMEPLPVGEWGELIITTLTRECCPMIRYRTRDLTRLIPEPCTCGRTHHKLDRLKGRTDDMLIIRGVNVFPSQIEQVITQFPDVATHYQIVLTTKDGLDNCEVQIETVDDFPFDEIRKLEKLRNDLMAEFKSNLQIKVNVRIVEPNTIARSEGKAKRIIDKREGLA
ncbi:phenylacetate--CoA ligase family protein [Slackia heliotrinireducens]|uniref:phenylacetate--CoA ligase family protein n=1 Tax=Slackia heliotrinireducens TaxID=84110 RepID=UPI003315CBCE